MATISLSTDNTWVAQYLWFQIVNIKAVPRTRWTWFITGLLKHDISSITFFTFIAIWSLFALMWCLFAKIVHLILHVRRTGALPITTRTCSVSKCAQMIISFISLIYIIQLLIYSSNIMVVSIEFESFDYFLHLLLVAKPTTAISQTNALILIYWTNTTFTLWTFIKSYRITHITPIYN